MLGIIEETPLFVIGIDFSNSLAYGLNVKMSLSGSYAIPTTFVVLDMNSGEPGFVGNSFSVVGARSSVGMVAKTYELLEAYLVTFIPISLKILEIVAAILIPC